MPTFVANNLFWKIADYRNSSKNDSLLLQKYLFFFYFFQKQTSLQKIFNNQKFDSKMADNLQNQVEQEFAALKSHIDQKQQELEKNHLRPHEHKAYKCAAACTANNKTSTLETRECVTNCMSPLERIQRMFQNRTNSVNQVIQNCMASCEGEVRTAVGDNPSDREMENARKVYMNCTLKCPTEAQPKIREAFDMLKNDIKNAGL